MTECYTSEGKKLIKPTKREENPSQFMREVYAEIDASCVETETQTKDAAFIYVESYHVDSQEGLNLIAVAIRSL